MLPVCRFIQTYLCLYQQALVKFISLIRMFLRLCADDASLRGRYSHPNDPLSKHQLSHRALISSDPDNSADSTKGRDSMWKMQRSVKYDLVSGVDVIQGRLFPVLQWFDGFKEEIVDWQNKDLDVDGFWYHNKSFMSTQATYQCLI